MTDREIRQRTRRLTAWMFLIAMTPVIYGLSSGPVLTTAFWLREATGWDGFYAAMHLYFPLLFRGRGNPIDTYIEWVGLLGTVGPG